MLVALGSVAVGAIGGYSYSQNQMSDMVEELDQAKAALQLVADEYEDKIDALEAAQNAPDANTNGDKTPNEEPESNDE